MQQASRAAAAMVESSVNSVRSTAHLAAFNANDSDVKALEWFGILDVKICANCAMRAGKLYTLDLEPIDHQVPIVGPPPLHPFCRCMFIPMPDATPRKNERFDKWLERQPLQRQEELLGVGRVQLWKEGRITLYDLIGQKGLIMSLSELKLKLGVE